MTRTLEERTMGGVAWRLLPLIVLIYFVTVEPAKGRVPDERAVSTAATAP